MTAVMKSVFVSTSAPREQVVVFRKMPKRVRRVNATIKFVQGLVKFGMKIHVHVFPHVVKVNSVVTVAVNQQLAIHPAKNGMQQVVHVWSVRTVELVVRDRRVVHLARVLRIAVLSANAVSNPKTDVMSVRRAVWMKIAEIVRPVQKRRISVRVTVKREKRVVREVVMIRVVPVKAV